MRVEWRHELLDEPLLLLSEIEDGYEVRKIELYRDGRADFADQDHATGSTMLSESLMPTIEELREDTQFVPVEIEKGVFEEAWRAAIRGRISLEDGEPPRQRHAEDDRGR